MAALIPQQLFDPNSALELTRDELQGEDCSHDWVILHSVGILLPGERRRRVVDFVIIIPDPATVICLGVANSPLDQPAGGWFQEAVERGRLNAAELGRRLPESGVSMKGIPVVTAVAFPDDDWPTSTQVPEGAGDIYDMAVFDEDGELCRRLAAYAHKLASDNDLREPLSRPSIDALRRYLAPNYDLRYGWMSDDEQRLLLTPLSSMEYLALQLVADNERCLFRVSGSAWRKSEMAAECVYRRYAKYESERTALLCADTDLAALLDRHTEDLPQEEDDIPRIVVKDWYSFIRGIVYDDLECARAMHEDPDYHKAEASGDDGTLQNIHCTYASEMLARSGPRFDYLVIDEAEVLLHEQYLKIIDAALVGGLANGKWAAFRHCAAPSDRRQTRGKPDNDIERPLLRYCPNPARLTAQL